MAIIITRAEEDGVEMLVEEVSSSGDMLLVLLHVVNLTPSVNTFDTIVSVVVESTVVVVVAIAAAVHI